MTDTGRIAQLERVKLKRNTPPRFSVAERFWPKVQKRKAANCWYWLANKDGKGYGTLSTTMGAAPAKAHRISWELHFGPIPDGLCVLHACDNPGCVNPGHLMLGTKMANAID